MAFCDRCLRSARQAASVVTLFQLFSSFFFADGYQPITSTTSHWNNFRDAEIFHHIQRRKNRFTPCFLHKDMHFLWLDHRFSLQENSSLLRQLHLNLYLCTLFAKLRNFLNPTDKPRLSGTCTVPMATYLPHQQTITLAKLFLRHDVIIRIISETGPRGPGILTLHLQGRQPCVRGVQNRTHLETHHGWSLIESSTHNTRKNYVNPAGIAGSSPIPSFHFSESILTPDPTSDVHFLSWSTINLVYNKVIATSYVFTYAYLINLKTSIARLILQFTVTQDWKSVLSMCILHQTKQNLLILLSPLTSAADFARVFPLLSWSSASVFQNCLVLEGVSSA